MSQESEDAESVVDGDKYHATAGPCITVHRYLMSVAVEVGSAMHPEGYWQFSVRLTYGTGWCPDVQIQAVLALNGLLLPVELIAIKCADGVTRLPADIAECVGHLDTIPLHDRLRTLPSEFTNGWGCIRDALEHGYLTC